MVSDDDVTLELHHIEDKYVQSSAVNSLFGIEICSKIFMHITVHVYIASDQSGT
jgi:hypothetical protein